MDNIVRDLDVKPTPSRDLDIIKREYKLIQRYTSLQQIQEHGSPST